MKKCKLFSGILFLLFGSLFSEEVKAQHLNLETHPTGYSNPNGNYTPILSADPIKVIAIGSSDDYDGNDENFDLIKVGIGTNLPRKVLHIQSSPVNSVFAEKGMRLQYGSSIWDIEPETTRELRFLTNSGSTIPLYLQNNGNANINYNLGINMHNPAGRLHVHDGTGLFTGDARVGINTPIPQGLLEVYDGPAVISGDRGKLGIGLTNTPGDMIEHKLHIRNGGANLDGFNSYMYIHGQGTPRLGVGTVNPQAKIHSFEIGVNQIGLIAGGTLSHNYLYFVPNLGAGGFSWLSKTGDVGIIFGNQVGNAGNRGLVIASSAGERYGIRIDASGRVGIGEETPTARLTVHGSGFAQPLFEVKNNNGFALRVDANHHTWARRILVNNTWADYVFDDCYELKPLSEVEEFIKTYKHLPNIPTAKKIEEEGLDLGEMQRLMMEKIEELTLHLIELNKKIQVLELEENKK